MLRKKSVQSFDSRHVTMIENAFYYCNPPERQKVSIASTVDLHIVPGGMVSKGSYNLLLLQSPWTTKGKRRYHEQPKTSNNQGIF